MPSSVWDLLIIGSGFGGSVCACRAAAAGMRVAVLERGPRATSDYYQQLARGSEPLIDQPYAPSLVRPSRVRGLRALSASAVGGTSHLYTAVTVPAPAEIFASNWPAGLNADSLRPHYARVEGMIAASPIPAPLPRTRVLHEAATRLRAASATLPLAMNWSRGADPIHPGQRPMSIREECVTWIQGGPSARKRTLDQTYLAAAESNAATILPLHEADAITPHDGGYRIDATHRDGPHPRRVSFLARRVVVAAGTLGTVSLLLRCRDQFVSLPNLSPALGRRFFTNGDFGGLLIVNREDLPLDAGPPVTAWIDLWRTDKLYLMETGFLPVLQRLASFPASAHRKVWSFGVMGFDDDPGTLRMDNRAHLTCDFDSHHGNNFHYTRVQRLRELASAIGGRLLLPPGWFIRRTPITVHPLGGAALADSPEHGVTNPFGECFGHPGLYIADGSLLPTPIGAAPSMTIAALAEHIVDAMLRGRSP